MSTRKNFDEGVQSEPKKKARRERVPLGQARYMFNFRPSDELKSKFVFRLINNVGSRIDDAINGGYRFVTSRVTDDGSTMYDVAESLQQSIDSRVGRVVGRNSDGSPIMGYLMAIPKEIYEKDQMLKEQGLKEKETVIRKGVTEYSRPGVDGIYVPPGGIDLRYYNKKED